MAQLVVGVEAASEDRPTLAQEHRVVNTQGQANTGAGQLNNWKYFVNLHSSWSLVTFRSQLHCLRAVTQAPAPAVTTGHHLARPREEGGVELLETNLRDIDVVLSEALDNVRLRPVCVVAKTKIEVRVCSPGISVKWRSELIRQVQRPIEDSVIQTREAVMVQQSEVSPGLNQPDNCPHLAMKHGSVQGAVARLRVLAVELTSLSTARDPFEHADQPATRRHMGEAPA